MTETIEPKLSVIDEFKALTTKQWLAILGGFVGSAVLTALNLAASCIGFLVIAVLLYMVPHMLGVASPKIKTVVGVVFIVVMLLCAITFLVAAFVRIDPEFGKKQTEHKE